ncbi:serine--tRNA ligase [Candidatus Marsarchaeota archaeon]|nr:serine--tRNA ligase [Candidatus Marsarchaeota archaeon]
MLTTRYIKENLDAIRKSMAKRKSDYPVDELLGLEDKSKKLELELQDLRSQRNKGSLAVAELKKSKKDASREIEGLASVKKRIGEMEAEIPKYRDRIDGILWNMPNTLQESVPYGKDDTENIEIKKVGKIPERKPSMGHEEALTRLGLLDIEQASKVSGARFFYLKGDLALLEQSLIHFSISELTKRGYTLVAPPMMMRKEYYRGVTALSDFQEMLYRAGESKEAESDKDAEHVDDGLFMIGTSEHPLAALHADQVFSAKDLPKKYIGFSPCFRREAGAHGKDTKGIFRVHQFYKVEQFIFSNQDSWHFFDELIANSEDLFSKLNLPYRVVNICTGDIGTVAAKKFDLEVYMPAQERYREMVSCSNCTDWQAMRLNIRYDEGGERRYVHTLNSTAIATNRTLVAIVENYLNEDGSITVPDALVPYMGKDRIR